MTLSQKFAKLQLVPADDSDCFLIAFFQCTSNKSPFVLLSKPNFLVPAIGLGNSKEVIMDSVIISQEDAVHHKKIF